jgi:hypothetical protein
MNLPGQDGYLTEDRLQAVFFELESSHQAWTKRLQLAKQAIRWATATVARLANARRLRLKNPPH